MQIKRKKVTTKIILSVGDLYKMSSNIVVKNVDFKINVALIKPYLPTWRVSRIKLPQFLSSLFAYP